MQPADFLLIRHAQSLWNATRRWQGQADPALSPLGEAQAKALGEELAGERIDALIASDLLRTMQTAESVGGPHGLVPQPDARLRELDVGAWAGHTRAEIAARWGDVLARFDAGDPDARPPGGETRREIRLRVRRAMAEIARERPDQRIAIVVHLGVIRALLPGRDLANAGWVEARADELASPDWDGSR